jgi:hypothetical protein
MGQRVLKLCSGRGAGQRYKLDGQGKVIGRAASAQASELHAMIVLKDGRVMLYDLGTESGTHVNERRVEETEVFPGDTIQVGTSLLEIIDEDTERASVGPSGRTGPLPSTGPLPNAFGVGGIGTGPLGTGPVGGGLGTGPMGFGVGPMGGHFTGGLGAGPMNTGGLGSGALGGFGIPGNTGQLRGDGLPNATGSLSLPANVTGGQPGAPDLSLPSMPASNGLMTAQQANALAELQARMFMGQMIGMAAQQAMAPYAPQMGGAPPIYTSPPTAAAGAEAPPGPGILAQIQAFYTTYRAYILTLAGCLVVGLVAGASTIAVKPPVQGAMFAVALTQTAQDNPLRPQMQNSFEFFRASLQAFKSPALIERTLIALGETDLSSNRIERVQASLGMEGMGRLGATITYQGTFKGDSSLDSLRVLGAHVQLFLDSEINKTLRVIAVQREFLQRQLIQTEKELRRTERELLEFKKKNIDGLPDQARQYYDLLFQLQQKQSQADVALARASVMKQIDRVRLLTESPTVENRTTAARSYRDQIVAANARLVGLRAEGKGDEHPDVVAIRNQIVELEQLDRTTRAQTDVEVQQIRNPQFEQIRDSLRLNEGMVQGSAIEAEQVRRDIERIRGVVERLPELETQYQELTRSYGVSKELHGKIFGQLKSTQLQYDLERAAASARYDLFQPPTLEAPPTLKTLILRGVMGAVVGAIVGGLACLGIYKVRKRRAAREAARQAPPPSTIDMSGGRAMVPMGPSSIDRY